MHCSTAFLSVAVDRITFSGASFLKYFASPPTYGTPSFHTHGYICVNLTNAFLLRPQSVKNYFVMQETPGLISGLGRSSSEEEMATHSYVLAWEIPWISPHWWATVPLWSCKSQTWLAKLNHITSNKYVWIPFPGSPLNLHVTQQRKNKSASGEREGGQRSI